MTQREAPFTNESEARNCERVMGDRRHGLMPETNQQVWDQRYLSREQLFSGEPNGVLVSEMVDLPPGQALDVGCGEGADARWLAERGWQGHRGSTSRGWRWSAPGTHHAHDTVLRAKRLR
ncbi:hypothetical protein [Saccharopolyspora hattusasensis]|uniref:hypothetical protein n=1 Tax=Saccharopolyspora hattusasensis TaxID=1128679 RepID=UPI003D97B06F